MRSNAVDRDSMALILSLMQEPNRLALLVSLATGLRISDVLSIKTDQISKTKFTVQEQKTGKRRTVSLSNDLRDRLARISGSVYVFAHRLDGRRHRTRQAVYMDMVAAARRLGADKCVGISPHSARKTYASTLRAQGLTVDQIRRALNHSDVTVTALYAYADSVGLAADTGMRYRAR